MAAKPALQLLFEAAARIIDVKEGTERLELRFVDGRLVEWCRLDGPRGTRQPARPGELRRFDERAHELIGVRRRRTRGAPIFRPRGSHDASR